MRMFSYFLHSTHRHDRTNSLLRSLDAVRSICQQLRARCPENIHHSDKQLLLMLEAVRNNYRRLATDIKRGRPPRWPRETLLEVARHPRDLPERETSGRFSLQTFIGQHLHVLRFPTDVSAQLSLYVIYLQSTAPQQAAGNKPRRD
jgi:hypothetical protein